MHAQSTPSRRPTASTFRPRVRRLGAGLYLVESATTPGLGHQATATTCGCRAGQFGKTCRHQRLVAALEPRFQAWYAQRSSTAQAPARPATTSGNCAVCGERDHDLRGSLCVLCEIDTAEAARSASPDAQLAAAAHLLAIKRRALADAHPQSDEYAMLLRAVDQAERAVAALDASAMRAA